MLAAHNEMDFYKTAKEIYGYITKRKAEKEAPSKWFVNELIRVCENLLEIDDIFSDKASFLHQELRHLYKTASTFIDSDKVETVLEAIVYGRLFYWYRRISIASAGEVEDVVNELLKRYPRSLSLYEFSILLDAVADGKEVDRDDIEIARDACLSAIVKLRTLYFGETKIKIC